MLPIIFQQIQTNRLKQVLTKSNYTDWKIVAKTQNQI